MATVPFSQVLCKSIIEAATKSFHETSDLAISKYNKSDQVQRTLMEEATQDIPMVDAVWTLYAREPLWFDKAYAHTTVKCNGIQVKLCQGRPQLAPYTDSIVYDLNEAQFPRSRELFLDHMTPWFRAQKDIKELSASLDKIFEECKNVNAALEVMPNILDWCPANTRDRLNAKAKKTNIRRSADEIRAAAFSDDSLAALARAKML